MRHLRLAVLALLLFATAACVEPTATAAAHRSAAPSPGPSTPPPPAVGTCRTGDPTVIGASYYTGPVDCAQPHDSETVYIGQLTAVAAALGLPPTTDDDALAAADDECARAAAAYVGGSLSTPRLLPILAVPSGADWVKGARWFECHVSELNANPNGSIFEARQGSARADTPQPLPPVCFKLARPGTLAGMAAVPCSSPHSAEYVGVTMPGRSVPAPQAAKDWAPYASQCRSEVADAMGVSASTVDKNWGYTEFKAEDLEWRSGRRYVTCYFALWNLKTISRSIRDSHGSGIPHA
jgi:hypothetical protein